MAAANQIMMGLGGFRFSLDTASYQNLVRETDFGWKSQVRASNLPHYQSVTKGADAIELKGTIYPHYKGGVGQVETMRAVAFQRKPLPLVTGRGRWLGNWVIMKIGESQPILWSNGAPRKQEFTMNLEYVGQ